MPRPLKIACWLEHYSGGGVERVALRLAKDWAALGHSITIFAPRDQHQLKSAVPANVHFIELKSGLLALPKALRAAAPDILFCPGNHYTIVSAWIRLRLGKDAPPAVWKVSNDLARNDYGWLLRTANRWWVALHHRFFRRSVAMSEALAIDAAARTGIRREAIDIIENPYLIDKDSQQVPPPTGRYIVGIGRLEKQKNWALAIDAFAAADLGDVQLIIFGEGSCRAQLETQVERLGLTGKVLLPGFKEGLESVIENAELLLLTSRFEGRPNVVVEALAMGTPVVATASSVAMRELISDGKTGYLVSSGHVDEVASAIGKALRLSRPTPTYAFSDQLDAARSYITTFERAIG